MMEKTGFICGHCGSRHIKKTNKGMVCKDCKTEFPQTETDSIIEKSAGMLDKDENKE